MAEQVRTTDWDALIQQENDVLVALGEAVMRGKLSYAAYSPAYDVTVARAAALSFAKAVEVSEGNAHTPPPSQEPNK